MDDKAKPITDFLIRVGESMSLAEAYKANPDVVLKEAGVPLPMIKAITTGDIAKIRTFLSAAGDAGDNVVVVVIVL